jgi:hypothetical protein
MVGGRRELHRLGLCLRLQGIGSTNGRQKNSAANQHGKSGKYGLHGTFPLQQITVYLNIIIYQYADIDLMQINARLEYACFLQTNRQQRCCAT